MIDRTVAVPVEKDLVTFKTYFRSVAVTKEEKARTIFSEEDRVFSNQRKVLYCTGGQTMRGRMNNTPTSPSPSCYNLQSSFCTALGTVPFRAVQDSS